MSNNELCVRSAFRLPIDPINIVSMSDYNLALLLFRNWFEFDDERIAKAGLITNWNFVNTDGGYWFDISNSAKWSDGTEITSEDLIFNINKIVSSNTSHGHTISSLLDVSRSKIKNQKTFFIATLNKMPTDSFFQRMGSIFLAIVSPKNFDSSGQIVSNSISSGPYMIQKYDNNELVLVRNPFWNNSSTDHAPSKVLFKKPLTNANFKDFINLKSWENITQISTMIPADEADLLIKKSLPMWTRDHDRVSLLRPVGGKKLSQRKELLLKMAKEKKSFFDKVKLPFNSLLAMSLQPFGYPLFSPLEIQKTATDISIKKISIAAPDTISVKTQIDLLAPFFKNLKISAKWELLPKEKFIPLLSTPNDYDYLFFDFGVADPEPVTWVSLIVNMKFAFIGAENESSFKKIAQTKSSEKTNLLLKEYLNSLANSGAYLPFFHFSTLSVAQPGISFEKIRDLDETVDYSKILFK